MPSSTRLGARASSRLMRANSSSESPCSLTTSGVIWGEFWWVMSPNPPHLDRCSQAGSPPPPGPPTGVVFDFFRAESRRRGALRTLHLVTHRGSMHSNDGNGGVGSPGISPLRKRRGLDDGGLESGFYLHLNL